MLEFLKYSYSFSLRCLQLPVAMLFIVCFSGCDFATGDEDVNNGAYYFKTGDYPKAIFHLKRAEKKSFEEHSLELAYNLLGLTYLEMEQEDSAIFFQKKALEVNPGYMDAMVNLGICYAQNEQFDLAKEQYDRALKIEPENVYCLASIGALHIRKQEPDLALIYLERGVVLDPSYMIVRSNYAVALAMKGRHDEASLQAKYLEGQQFGNLENLRTTLAYYRALEGEED